MRPSSYVHAAWCTGASFGGPRETYTEPAIVDGFGTRIAWPASTRGMSRHAPVSGMKTKSVQPSRIPHSPQQWRSDSADERVGAPALAAVVVQSVAA